MDTTITSSQIKVLKIKYILKTRKDLALIQYIKSLSAEELEELKKQLK